MRVRHELRRYAELLEAGYSLPAAGKVIREERGMSLREVWLIAGLGVLHASAMWFPW